MLNLKHKSLNFRDADMCLFQQPIEKLVRPEAGFVPVETLKNVKTRKPFSTPQKTLANSSYCGTGLIRAMLKYDIDTQPHILE